MNLRFLILPLINLVSLINVFVLIPFRRYVLRIPDEECVGGRIEP